MMAHGGIIVIRKEKEHKIIALEDEVIYYCVFALRDIDGDVTDVFDEENSPLWSGLLGPGNPPPSVKEKLEQLDKATTDNS